MKTIGYAKVRPRTTVAVSKKELAPGRSFKIEHRRQQYQRVGCGNLRHCIAWRNANN